MSKIYNFHLMKIFSLPIILYVIFIAIRVKGFQPPMEGELGDLITALNFLFGSFVSYFIFVFYIVSTQKISRYRLLWWWLMCMLLAILAFDELFMIHEFIGQQLGIKDTLVFLFYAGLLGGLLISNLEATFTKNTLFFLVLFTLFAVLSQGADYLYGEGIVMLMGREVSYEQFSESFGALCLSCAIVTIAIRQLINKEPYVNIDE